MPLVDHHVHGCFAGPLTRTEFECSINEASPEPMPAGLSAFDSQIGFAIRRWCAPVLSVPAHSDAGAYWARRQQLGDRAVAAAMLGAAGVDRWLIDTGHAAELLLPPSTMSELSSGSTSEILRLESLAESLLAAGISPAAYPDEFRARLAAAADLGVVGVKSIIAYRCGFDVDFDSPTDAAVAREIRAWIDREDDIPRLTSPVLAVFGIQAAARARLPIQLHVGFGDRDLDLNRVDPLLLLTLLRQPAIAAVPVMLLHCYPFHRQAGYLAQAFGNVHFDIGLAANFLGTRSVELVAESLELAPFGKQLFSSDAYGPPELHLLGSVLWRRGMARVLARWIREGDWSPADARRVVRMIGRDNAERVYGR